MNKEVDKFKCALGSHPFKLLQINKNFEIKICKVCGKILEDENIRWRVAWCLNTPSEILEKLSKDEDRMVRRRAKINFKNKRNE